MKTLIFILLAAISTFSYGQSDDGVTVTVVMNKLVNNEGTAAASLYNEATFMKTAPLDTKSEKIENKTVTVQFTNVKPGEYAIVTLHDMNGNNRMDFEANGMPKEAYGTSGEGAGFGPPQWGASKFTVGAEDVTIAIKM